MVDALWTLKYQGCPSPAYYVSPTDYFAHWELSERNDPPLWTDRTKNQPLKICQRGSLLDPDSDMFDLFDPPISARKRELRFQGQNRPNAIK